MTDFSMADFFSGLVLFGRTFFLESIFGGFYSAECFAKTRKIWNLFQEFR